MSRLAILAGIVLVVVALSRRRVVEESRPDTYWRDGEYEAWLARWEGVDR